MRAWSVAAAVCALLGTALLSGHHSFAPFYFEDQSVSVEGNILAFDYRNPHVWLFVSAVDKGGTRRRVSAEWASPGRLLGWGITRDTLKPGDRVILTGSPSRDDSEYKMHLKGIVRPADGWTWTGRTPR
jgi:hypothetical protein